MIEANSSNDISSRVFFQLGDNGLLHSITFFSKNLNPTKCNYMIYDKKLLAIMRCFEQQKSKLDRTGVPVNVITDYQSPKYFMITKKLIRDQAC